MTEIIMKRGEPIAKGLRRLKKVLTRERLFDELKKRRHYEKPSKTNRVKAKTARFNEMLRQRHLDS